MCTYHVMGLLWSCCRACAVRAGAVQTVIGASKATYGCSLPLHLHTLTFLPSSSSVIHRIRRYIAVLPTFDMVIPCERGENLQRQIELGTLYCIQLCSFSIGSEVLK